MNAVKELGTRLAARLDEDDWGYIEPFLNECETELESLRQQLAEVTNEKREYQLEAQGQIEFLDKKLAECQAELQSTRLQMITDFGQYQEAHEKVKELTDQVLAASNLLAVMHRDGGHHQLAVGFDQAIQDAMAVYYGLTAQRDAAIGILEHIRRCIPYGGFAQIHDGSATVADIDAAIANCKEPGK